MSYKTHYYRIHLIAYSSLPYAHFSLLSRIPTPGPTPLAQRIPAPKRLPRKVFLLKIGEHCSLLEFRRIV
ncbi:hypothetical protein KDI_18120 [Dictyobacter arantiisoli]|uniref:Uncharacterized protein n=1 Tax=Dictyobacter arantiisoli TaxID=2014874 RepID=A0A5A5TA25_9CHLR|nr:hypothetical protein KDI_18120 [Dictyobacter arantiisoli]